MDLSKLEKGATLHLNDIQLPKGVKPVLHGKVNPVLVTVVTPAGSDDEPAAEAETPAA